MIYPDNFEDKIGFKEIRTLLKGLCLSVMGREKVDEMKPSDDVDLVGEWLRQISEFRRLQTEADNFPLQYFFDVRQSVARLRLEGTHIEEDELFDLRRSLETIVGIVNFLNAGDSEDEDDEEEPHWRYPALHDMADGVATFPMLVTRIDRILDKYGHIKDSASVELGRIRRELAQTEGGISRTLSSILRTAQADGLVDKDAAPTMRDGRLVIPVAPALKRKIRGIVHDESATGKTVFVEPQEVVEANNRVRELEAEERREVIRILKEFSAEVRPHVREILDSYDFLGRVDLVRAKARMADNMKAIEPVLSDEPVIDWIAARHPLLEMQLARQQKKVVPLDILLTKEKHILIISGPNAGGKSVCLKTVGLLQYMLQTGLSVTMGERSRMGLFTDIMIDIGDEQSLEDDLSTYSGHLFNMKNMMKRSNPHTLLLIDEFGGGTEPQIGGAIAEAVLKQFCLKGAWGVITTHYQNLKHFADSHEGVENGAMLYDRHEMRPLFQLAEGRPGSSFAIEIARKTGLPDVVIKDASDIVGSDYIQSDKYLQDIVRDKRYWEGKRQNIRQQEKVLEEKIARYEAELAKLDESRREILSKAKEQAEALLKESNKKIENAIREIKESQAEKAATRKARQELNEFKAAVDETDAAAGDEMIARKMRQIEERRARREKRKREKQEQKSGNVVSAPKPRKDAPLQAGETVRIKGLTTVGTIEQTDGKMATVIFGDMRTKMRNDRLERADKPKQTEVRIFQDTMGRQTRETIDDRKLNFKQDLDVRGMRGDEALQTVQRFIDDATLVGMARVRILHGTGTGILRQLIRQYLATVPSVADFRDEHVQFGGAGITVVDLN